MPVNEAFMCGMHFSDALWVAVVLLISVLLFRKVLLQSIAFYAPFEAIAVLGSASILYRNEGTDRIVSA